MEYLTSSIQNIKGIGPAKLKLFNRLGINTVEDLLYHFPRSYKDKSEISQISGLIPEEYATVKVRIDGKAQEVRSKSGVTLIKLPVSDETGRITAVWFNNRFIKTAFKTGETVLLYGKIKKMGRDMTIEAPEYEMVTDGESLNLMRIAPEYPSTEGLYQKDIRKAVNTVLEQLNNKLADIFPEEFRKKYNLSEINFCINNIHFPETMYNLELARRRFKFEELFMLQSGLIHIKRMTGSSQEGISFQSVEGLEGFIEHLPFKLTRAQLNVISEVRRDMESSKVMNRLVQGDVGSGKTMIAVLALYICVKNSYQGIMMVPTEILAEQHFMSIGQLFDAEGIRIGMLKGSMTKKEKDATLEAVKNGDIDVLIGTHALIEEKVEFKNLGLVITDEQHRFGVRQRTLLSAKGNNPDVLVMTATPIPRTLSLILYGDLDISIIDELPPGRKKIETYYIDSAKKERLFNFIKKEIDKGRQAYIVCPLVEESEKLDLNSAVEYRDLVQQEYFQNYKVDLLHGKMKAENKNQVMEEFRKGNTHILVSTTVIEVGVNIPNATIMVIENAERFGMAQLHQLRGRVGRGDHQSYCILISDSQNKIARERLYYMTKTENGFEIAEKDLELRGGGEILGLRQHGLPELKMADILKDVELLKLSRDAVEYLYEHERLEDQEYLKMKKILDQRFAKILEEIILN